MPDSDTTIPDTVDLGYPLVDGIHSMEFETVDLALEILLETNDLTDEDLLDLNYPNDE